MRSERRGLMSAMQLIQLLEKHLELHTELLYLTNKKTEVLKKGDIESLAEIMKEEQKYIIAINKVEQERIRAATAVDGNLDNSKDSRTLAEYIDSTKGPEQEILEELRDKLSVVLSELKHANALNEQLIQQSLYFVNLTLDMILPQPQDMNYTNKNGETTSTHESRRSLFDSRA